MINKVIIVGNVGADPEVRALEGGVKVARLRVATTEKIYNRQTQETKDHTEWHTITLWRGLADVADKYIRKGSQVYVEGRLRSREWTDEAGNKRTAVEIVGDELKMLGRRSEGAVSGSDYQATQGTYTQQNSGGSVQAGAYNRNNANQNAASQNSNFAAEAEGEVDDLPF